jgi:peptidoglycan/LPS O-acetylase OafA/YrhL
MASRKTRPPRLDTLTSLRFFAALYVLLYHLTVYGGYLNLRFGARWWQFGYLGVPFFFALSGFVLSWTAAPNDTHRAFWRRRFARVYPLYFACMIPGVILALTGHAHVQPGEGVKAGETILCVVLLQAWIPVKSLITFGPDDPGWSLSAEAFFYAVFPFLLPRAQKASPRRLWLALPAVILAFAVCLKLADTLLGTASGQNIAYRLPLIQIWFFIGGMVIAQLVKRGVRFPPLGASISLIIGVIAVLGAFSSRLYSEISLGIPVYVELYMFPFALLLIGSAAQSDLRGRVTVLTHRALVKLGVQSYALYLVQFPLIMILLPFSPHGFAHSGGLAVVEAVALLTVSIAVAAAAHRLIEAPWNERLRHAPPSIITEQDLHGTIATHVAGTRPIPDPASDSESS